MDIGASTALDPARQALQRLADRTLPAGPALDVLRGRWLGHPVHPALTDLPIGFWTSAMAVDLLRGDPHTARKLVALGVVSAVPTMAAGLADWTSLGEGDARVGVVHAGVNAVALALYGGSWFLRATGRQRSGIAVSFVAAGAATVAGFLGGRLVFEPEPEHPSPRAAEDEVQLTL